MTPNKELAVKSAQTVSALRAIANKDKDLATRCSDYLAKNFIGPKYKLITGVIPENFGIVKLAKVIKEIRGLEYRSGEGTTVFCWQYNKLPPTYTV